MSAIGWTSGDPRAAFSTGVISGGVVTMNGATSVDITAAVGVIVDYATDPMNPVINRVTLPAQVAVPMSGASLARQITMWTLDGTGTLLQEAPVSPGSGAVRDRVILGVTVQIGAGIFIADTIQYLAYNPLQQLTDLMRGMGSFVVDGCLVQPIAASLTTSRSAGHLFNTYGNATINKNNPHIFSLAGASPQNLIYATQAAGSAEAVPHTNVYPDRYDVGGVMTTPVPGGATASTIQRMYAFTAGGGGVIVQYGQTVYNNINAAIDAINGELFTENPNLKYAIPIGALIIARSCVNLADTNTARFFSAGRLTGVFFGNTIEAP